VLVGDNGQGKTSVLEAIYVVATSKSFRTDHVYREGLREGDLHASISVTVNEAGHAHEQRVSFDRQRRVILLDTKQPERLSEFARELPVVVFHPGDLALVSGTSGLRRLLLDRIALFSDPASALARTAYRRAQRGRQLALERPRSGRQGSEQSEIDAYEELMALHGARWSLAREAAYQLLAAALRRAFLAMSSAEDQLGVRYHAGGSSSKEDCLVELKRRRLSDGQRHTTSFGPGRDDVIFELGGRSFRRHGSQGQKRLLTLALKLAELDCVREARQAEPVLLLDDIASELDPTTTSAVYDFLRETRGQIFATTTRRELFRGLTALEAERNDYELRAGGLVSGGESS
jgi:DNA replication and repair protein RecF